MKMMKKLMATLFLLVVASLGILTACGSSDVTLTFETNGAPAMEAVTVAKGTEYELPQPEWTGHAFDGWYLDGSFTGEPVKSVTAEENITFYAKWTELAAIRLDLDGGTLDGDTTLYLMAGDNIYNFVQSLVPVKSRHQFGEWLLGDRALTRSDAMPQEGVTLKAHYKVEYTVLLWKQNLAQNDYVHEETDFVTDYEYAGVVCTPVPEVHGFSYVEHAGEVASGTIDADPAQNQFKLYYDRLSYRVQYIASSGTPQADMPASETYVYGTEIDLPTDLSAEGYLFRGWLPLGSDEMYRVEPQVFGEPAPAAPKYTVEDAVELYPVWTQAYTDMFGGDDEIFVPDDASGTAYLLRAGVMFKGVYSVRDMSVKFGEGSVTGLTIDGKIFENRKFAILDEDRVGTYSLYTVGIGLDEDTTLHLDSANGLTYYVPTGSTRSYRGTYSILDTGELEVEFNNGDLAGQTLHMRVGGLDMGNGRIVNAFRIRNDTDIQFGELCPMKVEEDGISADPDHDILTLDGYGNATITDGESTTRCYYTRINAVIMIFGSSGSVDLYLHTRVDGRECYAPYEPDQAHVYYASEGTDPETERDSLTLDGCITALLQTGENFLQGYYTVEPSVFGDLVDFRYKASADSSTFSHRYFLIRSVVSGAEQGGSGTPQTHYYFEEKPAGYRAFYYSKQDGAYYQPLIVLNDDPAAGAKAATIYGYSASDRTFTKLVSGTYEYDSSTKLYTFTRTEVLGEAGSLTVDGYDFSLITEIVFGTETYRYDDGATYTVSYWFSVKEDAEEKLGTDYNEAEGGGKLSLVGPFCVYTDAEDTRVVGQYTLDGKILRMTAAGQTYLFELDDDAHSFVSLDVIGTVHVYDITTGYASEKEYLVFDGKGGAKHTYWQEESEVTEEGTYEADGDSGYKFTVGGSEKFKFVLVRLSVGIVFCKYNEAYAGTYTRTLDGGETETLVLDGYGLSATYTNRAEQIYHGMFVIGDEAQQVAAGMTALALNTGTSVIYIDFKKSDNSFTVRSGEYGEYRVVDNNGPTDVAFRFDGYGSVRVYSITDNHDIDADATYEKTGDGWSVTYTPEDASEPKTVTGVFKSLTDGVHIIYAFCVEHALDKKVLVDTADWSVLVLDDCGGATKHLQNGTTVSGGMYYHIDDGLLYYAAPSGAQSHLYRYSSTVAAGFGQPVEQCESKSCGYYTPDFDALLFDESGSMLENGETRYFYVKKQDGTLRLYKQDPEADGANDYGFVHEDIDVQFSSLSNMNNAITLHEKTYRCNGGQTITFMRAASDEGKYPLILGTGDQQQTYVYKRLFFTPIGSTFSVDGNVELEIGGVSTQRACVVTREVNDEGEATLYFIDALSGRRTYIDAQFNGIALGASDNTNAYSITGVETVRILYSTQYLQTFYDHMVLYGERVENDYGLVRIVTEYGENGMEQRSYVAADFGEHPRLTDSTGEPITFAEEQECTVTSTGCYVDIEGSDGVKYRVRFAMNSSFVNLGAYGYYLTLSRLESHESSPYTVVIERVLQSDRYEVGAALTISLKESDAQLSSSHTYIVEDTLFYFICENADENGAVTGATYYIIRFTGSAQVEDGTVKPFESVTVEKKEATRLPGANSSTYADVTGSDGGEVIVFAWNGNVYLAHSSTYDTASQTYTVTVETASGSEITFKINAAGETIVITRENA